MADVWIILSFIMLTALSVAGTHYERTNFHKNGALIADRMECESQMRFVFEEADKLNTKLQRCEKRKR